MTPHSYTITFACYNQLDYTKQFIASLDREEVDFSRIVAVDNGSTDGTREWLTQQGFGAVVLNDRNLGCGVRHGIKGLWLFSLDGR
jgi:GT2 family glycosyltransferase